VIMRALRGVNPTVLFVGLGLISTACYAAITYLYPITLASGAPRAYDLEQFSRGHEWAAGVYVVGLLVVFAAFAASLFVVRRLQKPLPLILGFGFLNACILLWIYPITAIDIFYYVVEGRMQALYGLNPMISPAGAAPLDRMLPFIGEWKSVPTAYGPLWNFIAATIVRLGFANEVNGPLAFKVLMLAAYAVCIWLLLWGTGRKVEAVLLFAWNPLVLLQGPAHAHNDLLMMTVAVLGLVLWEKRRWWWAAVILLALAASIKLPVMLLAPLLIFAVLRAQDSWGRRAWIFVASALLGAAAMLAMYIPYWPPWQNLGGLSDMFATQRTYTIASLIRLSLAKLQVPPPYDFQIPRTIGLIIFVACYIVLLQRIWTLKIGLYTAGFWAMFIYLLTSTSYRIWYPLWAIPLGILAHSELRDALLLARMRWRIYLLSLTSELSVLMFILLWRWVLNGVVLFKADWFFIHLITIPWQFGIPLLAPLLIRRRPPSDGMVAAEGLQPAVTQPR
jgi:hypothetical protein